MEADPRRRSGPVGAGSEGGLQGASEADLTERRHEPDSRARQAQGRGESQRSPEQPTGSPDARPGARAGDEHDQLGVLTRLHRAQHGAEPGAGDHRQADLGQPVLRAVGEREDAVGPGVAQDQVDSSTSALEQQLINSSNTALGGQEQQLTGAANATGVPGTNNAPSFTGGQSALGTYLAAGEENANAQEQGGAERALTMEGVAQSQLGQAQDNSLNAFSANQGKENATFTTAMQKIATTRATDVAKQSSDLQKEVARLQGVNISVAENNRNYNTAATKLGITEANTESEINSRAAATTLAARSSRRRRSGQVQ